MRRLLAALLTLGLVGCTTPCPTVQTLARFEWRAASGPVGYYLVEVDRNDEGFQPLAAQPEPPEVAITGLPGDRIVVRVQAWTVDSTESGAFSPESEQVCYE